MIRVIVKSQGTKLRLVTRDGPSPSLTTPPPPPGASLNWGTPKWGRAAVTSCRTLQHQAATGKTPTETWKSTPPSCSATSRCPAPPVGRSRQRCGPPLAPATTQKWGTTGTAAPQFCTRYDPYHAVVSQPKIFWSLNEYIKGFWILIFIIKLIWTLI